MAKKYLDINGLGVVWQKVKAEDKKIADNLQGLQGTINGFRGDLTALTGKLDEKVNLSSVGDKNGVAPLDSEGKIPTKYLPGSVDEILEFATITAFPTKGETSKIYVTRDTNLVYRWSGSAYVEISASLALGQTSSTAYPGDKGNKNALDIKALQETIGIDLIGNEVDDYIVINPNAGGYSYGINLNPQKIAKSTELPEQEELVTTGYFQERLEKINGNVSDKLNKTYKGGDTVIQTVANADVGFVFNQMTTSINTLIQFHKGATISVGSRKYTFSQDKLTTTLNDKTFDFLDESMALTTSEIEAILK